MIASGGMAAGRAGAAGTPLDADTPTDVGRQAAGRLFRLMAGVSTSSRNKPPLPIMAMLGETVVHGEDIRRPLGMRRDHPITTLTALAEYYQGSDQVVLAKGRIEGLRLTATDGPFATGSGLLVSGPTLSLIMAMTGRTEHCADLDGEGVASLRARGA